MTIAYNSISIHLDWTYPAQSNPLFQSTLPKPQARMFKSAKVVLLSLALFLFCAKGFGDGLPGKPSFAGDSRSSTSGRPRPSLPGDSESSGSDRSGNSDDFGLGEKDEITVVDLHEPESVNVHWPLKLSENGRREYFEALAKEVGSIGMNSKRSTRVENSGSLNNRDFDDW